MINKLLSDTYFFVFILHQEIFFKCEKERKFEQNNIIGLKRNA